MLVPLIATPTAYNCIENTFAGSTVAVPISLGGVR